MILDKLQKAIYEFRENDFLNRYPSLISMHPNTLVKLKKEIHPYLSLDENLTENETRFCGIRVVENYLISGFKVE